MTYDRKAMEAELRRDEGEVLHAYKDSEGYLTLGVGRLIDKRRGGGISLAESAVLLGNDMDAVEAELDLKLPWWRTLDAVRQRVLMNMAFNLGVPGLLKFHSTLKAVRESRWEAAAAGMESSLWHRQVGARAHRLEAMMRTGNV